MPRLDNSDYTVIKTYKLEFDENDPGRTDPIDLCNLCYCSWLDAELDIEHPSYGDDVYNCFECGKRLTDADNETELS